MYVYIYIYMSKAFAAFVYMYIYIWWCTSALGAKVHDRQVFRAESIWE